MSRTTSALSDDEVRQIATLVEALDRSSFDFLQLEVGGMKVTLGKGVPPGAGVAGVGAAPAVAAAVVPAVPTLAAAPVSSAAATAAAVPASPATPAAPAAVRPASRAAAGDLDVASPMMGRYYAQPEPGAAPFVTVGATIAADTTIGLIEVMKVFTAVPAGVAGVVTEICVADAEFVEFGQLLIRVRPA